MKAINIIWDVDYEEDLENLPTEIDIPDGMTDEDEISDYISDKTGFCHKGFELNYDGMIIHCPDCGEAVTIEFGEARCEACGWLCSDGELDDVILE